MFDLAGSYSRGSDLIALRCLDFHNFPEGFWWTDGLRTWTLSTATPYAEVQGCCLLQDRIEGFGVETSWRAFERIIGKKKRAKMLFFFNSVYQYFIPFFFEFYFICFLYSRFLLVIHFIHISLYMSIPISQFIPPPPPPPPPLSPLGVHTFVLYICVSISALQTGSSVPFF